MSFPLSGLWTDAGPDFDLFLFFPDPSLIIDTLSYFLPVQASYIYSLKSPGLFFLVTLLKYCLVLSKVILYVTVFPLLWRKPLYWE